MLSSITILFCIFCWVLYESWTLAIAEPNIAVDYSGMLHAKALKLTGGDVRTDWPVEAISSWTTTRLAFRKEVTAIFSVP